MFTVANIETSCTGESISNENFRARFQKFNQRTSKVALTALSVLIQAATQTRANNNIHTIRG